MKDNYFIGIYWGVRKEGIDNCADKISTTLNLLSSLDESFGTWYRTTRPRKGEVLQSLNVNKEGIKSILLKAQNRNDLGELLEDLGYTFSIKSENNYSQAHVLSFSCGIFFDKIPNCVTLNIGKNKAYEHLTSNDFLRRVCAVLSEVWEPDKTVIRCNDNACLTNKR